MTAILPRCMVRRLEAASLARKIARRGSPELNLLPAAIRAGARMDDIAALWKELRPAYEKDPVCAAKYADPDYWLLLNTLRAARLDLHKTRGLRILDIGCGPGYFMAAACALGHHCEGVDAPDSILNAVERRAYSGLLEALGCRQFVSPLLIERFSPLPFRDRPYDLVTAFWICFNRHRQADEWGVDEWRFFVEDAMLSLREGGRLFLELNEHPERFGDLRWYDRPTLEFFRSVGTVDGGRVLIQRPPATAEA